MERHHTNNNPSILKATAIGSVILLVIQTLLILSNKQNGAYDYSPVKYNDDDNNDMLLLSRSPVLVMGLPRSGSIAIHEFFQCQNIPSSHYCCTDDTNRTKFPCEKSYMTCGNCVLENMKANKSPFMACGNNNYKVWSQFDVETSDPFSWFLPQHFTLPLLHQSYPNATFILNKRSNATTWANSVLHWHSITTRLFHAFDVDEYPPGLLPPPTQPDPSEKVSYDQLVDDMQQSLQQRVFNKTELDRKRQLLQNIYHKHIKLIQQWNLAYPSHSLIEINVDSPDSATILAKAFGLTKSCPWTFNTIKYDNDWKNFTLPF